MSVLEKELFVSGLGGGPPHELALHLAVLALTCAVVRASRVSHWALQLLLYAGALCLSMTLMADWLPLLLGVLAIAAFPLRRGEASRVKHGDVSRAVLDVYRGGMMLATCIAILAVDFPAFPRRLAKTEEYGWSLMDLGVGSFLFSAGLVSRASSSVARAAVESAVVVVLGAIRYLLTTAVGYQQHVTEYGTHWNFFLTIGLLLFAARALRVASWPAGVALAVGAVLVAATQWALTGAPGVAEYVLTAPRVSWLSHNREGVVSLTGFFAILLWGVESGKLLRDGRAAALWRVGAVLAVAAAVLHSAVQSSSRRMANAAYCCGVAALNCGLLAALQMVYTMFPGPPQDVALSAISLRQLPVFLLANVSTGLVNLSLNTLTYSSGAAFAIVLVYSLVIGSVAQLVKK
jgi:phosphatidylinositol glycan class W